MEKVKILVVEDSDRDFDLIESALAASGQVPEVHRVRDGVEATDYLGGHGIYRDRTMHQFPDIVLVDLKMPRMNGFEFLEWIEHNPQHRVIPTIVMSSSAVSADVERAYNSGAHSYFVKPIDYREFTGVFQRIIAYWAGAVTPGSVRRAG
jgi:two-component system, response regulator